MQAVPSLVGTGTAVAAAATGLVFGQLADTTQEAPSPPNTGKRKALHQRTLTPTFLQPSSRPSTSRPRTTNCVVGGTPPRDQLSPPPVPSLQQQQQPRIPRTASNAQLTPPKSAGLRPSTSRQTDPQHAAPAAENARDSVSSNGSWVKRRLSVRPLSQHGSQRSSGGPDAQSLFSFGSGVPMLGSGSGSGANTPPQRAPNKLVKRASATTAHGPNPGPSASNPLKRSGSRTQMTLRRPATSHQRSATLEQVNLESLPPLPMSPAYAPAPDSRPRAHTLAPAMQSHPPALEATPELDETPSWRSFWHARITRVAGRSAHLRLAADNSMTAAKRIRVDQPQAHKSVYLMSPGSAPNTDVADASFVSTDNSHSFEDWDDSPKSQAKSQSVSPEPVKSPLGSPDFTPSKKPRRSLSTHFHSPSNWISKTGSIRRRKRGETMGDEQRHVSAPTPTPTASRQANTTADASAGSRAPSRAESDLAAIFQPPDQPRNSSSPLPTLSRLSSFHMDAANRSTSSSSTPVAPSNGFLSDAAPILPSQQRVESGASHTRTLERASTVGSSEYHRGFTSGDDDDTDTPFDSLRTAASARRRNADSPLESMFDESPPSTAGNGKPKRLSIQEILGPAYEPGNRILEEDENTTPVRGTFSETRGNLRLASASHFAIGADSRLSLDDDDDLDWTEGDESALFNNLSPPSSMNSRRGSPSMRMALANISGNTAYDPQHETINERPRSNIFDWVEPSYLDKNKNDSDKSTYRPKTVHGKRELDVRGGRSASRKVPTAAHVRSQSVPAAQEPPETTKATPKFGTWGLGTKNVSEDWDDDFDFDEEDEDEGLVAPAGKKDENRFSMLVPASIQATQPTVKAHSGQIRELSLLVNDLKRLCRLGREMDMLSGSSTHLWREAEGVIALASPDEDLADGGDTKAASADQSDAETDSARCLAQGYDGASLDQSAYVIGHSHAQTEDHVSNEDGRFYGRRRSVFAPEDEIFGNWDRDDKENTASSRPITPITTNGPRPKANGVARSVMAAVDLRHSRTNLHEDTVPSVSHKLNFDTNSLKELVKQASDLRDSLSDLVRKADCITQSPARTPKRERLDGSPAFTRVFDDPAASPSRKLPQSRSNNASTSDSVSTSPSNGLNQRLQMMTVS